MIIDRQRGMGKPRRTLGERSEPGRAAFA